MEKYFNEKEMFYNKQRKRNKKQIERENLLQRFPELNLNSKEENKKYKFPGQK